METFKQGFAAAKAVGNGSMDMLGSLIQRAPGFTQSSSGNAGGGMPSIHIINLCALRLTASNSSDFSNRKRARETVRIDVTSPEVTSSHTLPSSQKTAPTPSDWGSKQPGSSTPLGKPTKNAGPTRVLLPKPGETSIPAIRDGIGKLNDGPMRSSYAAGSSANGRPRPNRSATSQVNGGNDAPPPNPAKKQKIDHRALPVVEHNLTALSKRSEREQQQAATAAAPRQKPKPVTYSGKGNAARPGLAVKKNNGMKQILKKVDAPPEVITLDGDSDEDEVMPQAGQPIPRLAISKTETTSYSVTTSERTNGKVAHAPSLHEVTASAASGKLSSSVPKSHDSLAQHLDPTTSASFRSTLPPLSQLAPTKVKRDISNELFETTGYSVGSVGTVTTGHHKRWTSGSTTPIANSTTPITTHRQLPKLAPPAPAATESPVMYRRNYVIRQTERSESPETYGDPNATADPTTERPGWVDNPDPVDAADIARFYQIPEHLRMNFVGLANELECEDLDCWDCGAEEYIELRGWADQAIQTPGGGGNERLDVSHAIAALRCWRLLKSRQILKAEREGGVFVFSKKSPAGQQDPDGDVPMVSVSQEGPTTTDQPGPSRIPLPPAPRIMSEHGQSPQPKQSPPPSTPQVTRGMTPIEIAASPENTQEKGIQGTREEIDTFGSPVAEKPRQRIDDIQTPTRAVDQPLTAREEPIEDEKNKHAEVDFEII